VKPRYLGILAGLASIAFGYWLLEQPHSSRELFLCMIAWVLGFWVATGIRGSRPVEYDDYDEEEDEEEGEEDE
jgi:hypothetical protein